MIKEIKVKSIITKSELPDAEFVINPYVGCLHNCLYCYARFMKRFTGHQEPWGRFCDVKINAPDLIPKNTTKYQNRSIFLSSVTDPYLPLERKYQLTRQILQKLIPLQPQLDILTKSDLVVRDVDILKEFKELTVGLTINTLDDTIRRELESASSAVQKRLDTLRVLKEAKISTYVFISPIFPYLTDWQKIISATKPWADCFMFENLNIKGSVWASVKEWLSKCHPNLLSSYEKIYFQPNNYWDGIESDINNYCRKQNINYKIYFHHKKSK